MTTKGLRLLALCLAFAVAISLSSCSTSATPEARTSFRVPLEVSQAAKAWHDTIGHGLGTIVGRLVIPRIELQTEVLEGTDASALEHGPGHWEESPFPGEGGRCVISGHRTTFGGVFRRLGELQPGDTIEMHMRYGVIEYEVFDSIVVKPDRVDAVRQRGLEELSLATCHPPNSGEYRLVVQARAVGFRPGP
jgi:LPXTG-site transpeptidase (sortase) family protein